jgi:hypothetical protein
MRPSVWGCFAHRIALAITRWRWVFMVDRTGCFVAHRSKTTAGILPLRFAHPVKIRPLARSALDAAGERLDEIAPGKSKGNHGRQHVENRQRAQEAVVDLLDAQKSAKKSEWQHLKLG